MDFQGTSSVLVFAYGSNLHPIRMRSRVSSARAIATGYVRHRRFVFHKKSIDGSAKADARYTGAATDQVWGVVYRIASAQKPDLDQHEFLGIGYDETIVPVVCENRTFDASIYVARAEAIEGGLMPYCWYKEYVCRGASAHELPSGYIKFLESFDSTDDPDGERRASHHEMLAHAFY